MNDVKKDIESLQVQYFKFKTKKARHAINKLLGLLIAEKHNLEIMK